MDVSNPMNDYKYSFQPYVQEFLKATDHYRNEEWAKVTERMEKALALYLEAEEECRYECEKPFDMGWYPDFIASISSNQ